MNTDNRTDEELNRIIAEWMGNPEPHWICIRCNQKVPSSHVTYEETHGIDSCLGSVTWIESPNYCRDLNAVHEAEKKVLGSSTGWCDFALALMNVLHAADMSELDGITCILQATARQRTEALVRVIEESNQ